MIGAVAAGGREQGKPAEAGHCSRRRDPAPGMWGHSVPKKPSWTIAAREQRRPLRAWPDPLLPRAELSVSLCANYLLVDCALYPEGLRPAPADPCSRARLFPKTPSLGKRNAFGPRPAQNLQKRLRGRASWQEEVQQRWYCVVGVGKGSPGRKLVSRPLKQ